MTSEQLIQLAQSLDDLVQGITTILEHEQMENGIYTSRHAMNLEAVAVSLQQEEQSVLRLKNELSQERSQN